MAKREFSASLVPLIHLIKAEVHLEPLKLLKIDPLTLKIAKKNDILLLALLRSSLPKKVASFADQLAYLKQLQVNMIAQAKKICSHFNERGLPFIFIKSLMKYPHVDHDLDIVVVEDKKLQLYQHEILKIGYQYKYSKARIREPDKYFYYLSPEKKKSQTVQIHLHKALSWNGVTFLNAAEVWERCSIREIDGLKFPIPNPEDEILIAAAHAIFENAEITLGELLEMMLLLREEDIYWDYVIEKAVERNWGSGLALFLEIGFQALERMRIEIETPLIIKKWVHSVLRGIKIFPLNWRFTEIFPFRIPYSICMRVYSDKLYLDFKNSKVNEFHRALASFFFFIWIMRWRSNWR